MSWKTLACWSVAASACIAGCGETTTRDDAGVDASATADTGRSEASDTGVDAAAPIDTGTLLPADTGVLDLDGGSPAIDAFVLSDAGVDAHVSSDTGTDAFASPDAALDGGPLTGVSMTYIVGTMTIPNGPAAGVTPGFNLDGINSGMGGGVGCVASNADYTSTTGEPGVDNLFVGSVVSTLMTIGGVNVQTSVDDQIASGALLLAMRVNDIDSYTSDARVTLDLFLVKQAACAGAMCPVVGGVMPGQAWRQRAVAYVTGAPGTITGGTLRSSAPSLPLTVSTLNFEIQNANISAVITPTGLRTGQIGGTIPFAQVLTAAMMIMPGVSESLVRGIVHPDLNPRVGMPATCDGVSIGYGFTAVPALSVAPL